MSNATAIKMNGFISRYGIAAKNAAAGSNIFPETILTAAALESGYGESALSAKYNNFFGIKADSSWKGKYILYSTKEEDSSGKTYTVNAKFRVYDSAQESFSNYVKFVSGPRYIKAGVTVATTPIEQFAKLKAAGYATSSKYVEMLTSIYKSVSSWVVTNSVATGSIGTIAFAGLIFFLITNKKRKKAK
ncbi:MAG: glucosaminidase domain-containing protein [Ferruginibacter sp.]